MLDQTQQALLDLWMARRGDRAMPLRRDFDTLDFVPWMGDLNMLEVVDDGADFIYRVFATNVALLQGYELTGSLMSSHPNPVAKAIGFSCYRETCRTGMPYVFRRPVVLNVDIDREQTVIRENLVLPLGSPDRGVDRILVLQNPKAYPPKTRSDRARDPGPIYSARWADARFYAADLRPDLPLFRVPGIGRCGWQACG